MTTYADEIAKGLSRVYDKNSVAEGVELADLRVVIFSDLHKGQRDGADDFQRCEQTYLAAADYYWADQFELLLLGDVEELWECRPAPVVREYEDVLVSEQRFADASPARRYKRFVGNHDDQWYFPDEVQKYLGPYLGGNSVIEGLQLTVHDQGAPLGELFLVHGHQGTPDSDRYAGLSALVVRYVWRPIQRVFNIRSSTPSNNFALRAKHELAMYSYAERQSSLVLIAGHTHHPVWEGLSLEQAMETQRAIGPTPEVDAQWMSEQTAGAVPLPGRKPCYFNTGCCSYSDGSITGIELADGEIRLVRWEPSAVPNRVVLFSAELAGVLQAVSD